MRLEAKGEPLTWQVTPKYLRTTKRRPTGV